MKLRYNGANGFTLIEIIIVLAIIGLLAATIAPTLVKYVQNSKVRRATKDVEMIGGAIGAFYNDLGDWPIWQNGTARRNGDPVVALLVGPGDLPAQGGAPSGGVTDTLENQLHLNTPLGATANAYPIAGESAWKGPYIEQLRPDPWGNAYLANVKFLWPGNETGYTAAFVLSAGPNEVVDTDFDQTAARPRMIVGEDDVVFRIK